MALLVRTMLLPAAMFTQLYLVNQSSVLLDSDLTLITTAVVKSLIDFCTEWKLSPVTVASVGKGKAIPAAGIKLYLLDDADIQGAFGYHTLVNDIPLGKVFVKTIQAAGGPLLYSPSINLSVSQVVSHEVFEILGDLLCNTWWMAENGATFYAAELCDPVQGNMILNTINGKTVATCDYILPAWSDPQAKTGPFNKLNTLKASMTVDKHGYVLKVSCGSVQYIFGDSVEQAVKDKQYTDLKSDARFSALRVLT